MASLVLANAIFVIFDLSYIKMRDLYLWIDIRVQQSQQTPQQRYLKVVDNLKQVLAQSGVDSPQAEALFRELRQLSVQIFIENPPFRIKTKSGALGEIYQHWRDRLGTKDIKQAVETFWSRDYFALQGWQKELTFFDQRIRYLILFYEPMLSYDIVKGLEPNRDTEIYLRKVAQLRTYLELEGLNAPNVNSLLTKLRDLSAKLVDGSYFEIAQKTGNLEEIKHRVKRHIFDYAPDKHSELTRELKLLNSLGILDLLAPELLWSDLSSKNAFDRFWSRTNLTKSGWQKELDFFDTQIRFLMRANYYRHIGANNQFIDRFWLIDIPWIALFGIEFLLRIWLMHKRDKLPLTSAIAQRWYDLFLLYPWFAPLRLITALIRLDRARLINLDAIRTKLRLGFVTSFAEELIQVLVSKGIDQLQNSVSSGVLKQALFNPTNKAKPSYVDINNVNEFKAIANRLIEITACRVLPEIHDDLEAWLRYQVEKALQKSSIYQKMQRLPLLRRLPNQIKENIVNQITTAIADSPKKAYEASQIAVPDVVGEELQKRLVDRFSSKLRTELQQEHTFEEIESLLCDFLEEIKINYLNRAEDPDIKRLNSAK